MKKKATKQLKSEENKGKKYSELKMPGQKAETQGPETHAQKLSDREKQGFSRDLPNGLTDREMLYAVVILVLIGGIIYFFITGGFGKVKDTEGYSKGSSSVVNYDLTSAATSLPVLSKNYSSTLPILGNESAPIAIIEFGDYQCPFCGRFYTEAEKHIDSDYIKTGKVRFYYKDFPQSGLHDKAMLSSNFARCANEQNKFWEMHNKLYENMGAWEILQLSTAKQRFREYANELGLDTSKLDICIDSEKYKEDITRDIQDGARIGVIGTPTFLIYIPKSNANIDDVQRAKSAIRGSLVQQGDKYIIIIEGFRDYYQFKTVFDTVK